MEGHKTPPNPSPPEIMNSLKLFASLPSPPPASVVDSSIFSRNLCVKRAKVLRIHPQTRVIKEISLRSFERKRRIVYARKNDFNLMFNGFLFRLLIKKRLFAFVVLL